MAYFSLSPTDIDELEHENTNGSRRILTLRSKPRTLLATILISNNFINIAIVILADFLIWNFISSEIFEQWGYYLSLANLPGDLDEIIWARILNFLVTTVCVTFILVLFGEVAPKIYAKLNNRLMARVTSIPLIVFYRIAR